MKQYYLYGWTVIINMSLPLKKDNKNYKKAIRIDFVKSKENLSLKNNLWSFDSSIILNKKNNHYLFWAKKNYSKIQMGNLISNVIVPHILSLNGELIVHGSCVTINNKGIIFAGVSGVGKSSIAHLAQDKLYALVSDDKVLLKQKSSSTSVFGGDHKIKLIESKTRNKILKKSFVAKSVRDKIKLSSIFILNKKEKSGQLKIKKLKGINKFKKMLPHVLVLRESTGNSKSKVVSAAFDTFHAVNIWMVDYPHVNKNKDQLLGKIKKITERL